MQGMAIGALYAVLGVVYFTVGATTWPVGHDVWGAVHVAVGLGAVVACWRCHRHAVAVAGGIMLASLLLRATSIAASMRWGSLALASDAARDSGWVAIGNYTFAALALAVAWGPIVRATAP